MKERCQPCKEWGDHFYWNHFKPKGMSFIKVMDSGLSRGMFIPAKFVKNVKRKLPENMSLRDPNGNLWRIKLLKVQGSLWVKNGWKEFVDANHVEKKDFLVFRYDGKACFNVLIFDSSGCEKEDSFIERRSNAFECPDQVTKEEYDDNSKEKVSASFVEEHGHDIITNYRGRFIQRALKRREVTEEEEAMTFKSALAFKTVRPFFIIVMRPSHVYKSFFMTVPAHFASQHMKHRKQIVLLRVPKRNKEWHVRYVWNGGSWGFNSQQWRSFVLDNKLEEGDACVFELIASQTEVVMHVHIFRVVQKVTTAVKEET